MMDRSRFLELIRQELPALRPAVNEQAGQLHLEIEAFRRYAQRTIIDGDSETLAVCFHLADEAYSKGDATLKKAIDVSFVEGLDFVTPQKSYRWAWDMMPAPLKRLYEDFHGRSRTPIAGA